MYQQDLFLNEVSLFDRLCDPDWLRAGYFAVKRNKGAPGIDGVSISDFGERLEEELIQLANEIKGWAYKPKPVKRVEIDKPGGGIRLLGIPTMRS